MFHFVCVFCLIWLIPGIISGGGLGKKKLLQLFLLSFTRDYLTNKTAKKMRSTMVSSSPVLLYCI